MTLDALLAEHPPEPETAVTVRIPGAPPLTRHDFWREDEPPDPDHPEETPLLSVILEGEPVPKSRARLRVSGRGKVSSYTPRRTVSAQDAVAMRIRAAFAGDPIADRDFEVVITYRLASWQRRDLDNLTKLVMDACTGIVWADDSQVRALMLDMEHVDDRPGTLVEIWDTDPQRPPTTPCGHCGKALRTFPSWSGAIRYCDATCRAAANDARRERGNVLAAGSSSVTSAPLLQTRDTPREVTA